ncbi:hypothetical protein HY229_00990 [Candidatus Acetothermia bacterium]|nr:hypothetical protein [Candidatus Acetothermia bacterium]MBI3642666.1 hypothetical protein [Candidatus Acetothermia bacterium]
MLRSISIIGGILVALLGIVWILQGINVIPGAFMSGQSFWAFMGVIAIAVGGGLIYIGAKRPAS